MLSDLDVKIRIAPGSEKWPSPDVAKTITWDRARACVTALHQFAHGLDEACAAVEADVTLSPEGKRRQLAIVGQDALRELADYQPFLRAKKAAERDIEQMTARMVDLPQPPTSPAEISDNVEVRSFIKQTKSPIDYIMKHLGNKRVLSSVWNSALPALLGLTQAEFDHVRSTVTRSMYPVQSAAIAQLNAMLSDIDGGMASARRLVCDRAQVRQDNDGQVRAVNEPAPAQRLTVVGQAS